MNFSVVNSREPSSENLSINRLETLTSPGESTQHPRESCQTDERRTQLDCGASPPLPAPNDEAADMRASLSLDILQKLHQADNRPFLPDLRKLSPEAKLVVGLGGVILFLSIAVLVRWAAVEELPADGIPLVRSQTGNGASPQEPVLDASKHGTATAVPNWSTTAPAFELKASTGLGGSTGSSDEFVVRAGVRTSRATASPGLESSGSTENLPSEVAAPLIRNPALPGPHANVSTGGKEDLRSAAPVQTAEMPKGELLSTSESSVGNSVTSSSFSQPPTQSNLSVRSLLGWDGPFGDDHPPEVPPASALTQGPTPGSFTTPGPAATETQGPSGKLDPPALEGGRPITAGTVRHPGDRSLSGEPVPPDPEFTLKLPDWGLPRGANPARSPADSMMEETSPAIQALSSTQVGAQATENSEHKITSPPAGSGEPIGREGTMKWQQGMEVAIGTYSDGRQPHQPPLLGENSNGRSPGDSDPGLPNGAGYSSPSEAESRATFGIAGPKSTQLGDTSHSPTPTEAADFSTSAPASLPVFTAEGGESIFDVARVYLANPARWVEILELNPQEFPTIQTLESLPPGKVLRLPGAGGMTLDRPK